MARSQTSSGDRIRVVAAIIERDGRFLVCRRSPTKRYGGLWEFPGGKLESGESHCDAAKRELNEELGVSLIHFQGILFSLPDPESEFTIDFGRASVMGDPVALEHTELRWVNADELEVLDLAPSDRLIAEKLKNQSL